MENKKNREVVLVVRISWLSKILIFLAVILAWAMPFLIQQIVNQMTI